jgi:hypothetical protein
VLPSFRPLVRSFDNSARPFFALHATTLMGFIPIAIGDFVVVHARGRSVIYAYDSNRSPNTARLEPYRWCRQQLRCEKAEIERVRELNEEVCRRADDLFRLGSIVDVLVELQDCSEESIGRHIDAFGDLSKPKLSSI